MSLEQFRTVIRRVVRSRQLGLSREDHEDIEQEAMLDVYLATRKNGGTLGEPAGSFIADADRGLAATIAVRRSIDAKRRLTDPIRSALTGVFGERGPDETGPNLEESIESDILRGSPAGPEEEFVHREMMFHLNAQLRDEERALLTLVIQEYSYDEIAEVLEISVVKVKSRVHELRKRCRALKDTWERS